MWRVPNSTAKVAIDSATNSARSPNTGCEHAGVLHRRRQDRPERGGDGFELKRDVGHGADDRDQRHRRGDRLALAVARGDEVGDRRDVLRLGEPHHAQDQRREDADHEDRPDIDGQEFVAGARGVADRAEERPGRAVDRERERIDPQPRAALRARAAQAVAIARHQEQEPDVTERDRDNDPALQHQKTRTHQLARILSRRVVPASVNLMLKSRCFSGLIRRVRQTMRGEDGVPTPKCA